MSRFDYVDQRDEQTDLRDIAIEKLEKAAMTPADTALTPELSADYAGLNHLSADEIIRWWQEDKRRREQGFKDDNWSRLLLTVLHVFKDMANRDATIASLKSKLAEVTAHRDAMLAAYNILTASFKREKERAEKADSALTASEARVKALEVALRRTAVVARPSGPQCQLCFASFTEADQKVPHAPDCLLSQPSVGT